MDRVLSLSFKPIADAPVKKGKPFGPCLLAPGIDGNDYAVGEWDGEDWFTLDGDRRLSPSFYELLPPLSSLVKG
jgi:hypothetical protein